ncbi:asparaginase [Psychromicrobium xiongbiense]|uniref:asparaginase n=1 Tax=Psychromicrobium xiongbiense TaxID=3051184 RepID=UPI0025577097|nr:asparaginase [Psychromicrobium sp. YIM S02556]
MSRLETFRSQDAVELAVVERSQFIESRHLGSAVLTAADGSVVLSVGDPSAPIYARSTLKPFQALASMQAGVPLRGAQAAIASGSHCASLEHLDLVRRMLQAGGVSEEQLLCPPAWPQDTEAYQWMLRTDRSKTPLAMNCSGKHAAFLWACTENGWDTASYLNPVHPLQQLVLAAIEDYADEAPAHMGTDGCGAPVAAISLTGLARAYGKLGRAPGDKNANARAATIATAMLDYPWAVEGRGRPNTVVMERLGILAKLGAEGVLALATDTGVGVAVKVLDGNGRAASLVGLMLLAASGAVPAEKIAAVLPDIVEPVLGGGRPVGQLRLGAPVSALLDG